jgi:hypothetical protein
LVSSCHYAIEQSLTFSFRKKHTTIFENQGCRRSELIAYRSSYLDGLSAISSKASLYNVMEAIDLHSQTIDVAVSRKGIIVTTPTKQRGIDIPESQSNVC